MRRPFGFWASLVFIGVLSAAQTPQGAQELERRGDWPGAEAAWKTLVQRHPDDYRYWTSLGICLAHQNEFSAAIQAYRKALALNPRAPQAEFNLGLAYFKAGQLENALAPLKNAASELPGTQQVQLLLGMCLYGTGRYREALPPLEFAEAKDPNNPELRFVLAQAYLWSGEYDKAKLEFQSVLEHNADSAQAHILLGEAYDGLGQTNQAIGEFQKAIDSGLPEAHFGLAYLFWKTHQYDRAVSEFRKELVLDPEDHKALGYLGDSELKLGETSIAAEDLTRSIALRDDLWIAQFDLGTIEQDRKNYRVALKRLRRAVDLDPSRPEIHYRLAQIYKALGNKAQARVEFAAVARLHAQKTDDLVLKVSGDKPALH